MKINLWLAYTIVVFLSGITVGIPIGLILDDFIHQYSIKIVSWVYRKIGWDMKFIGGGNDEAISEEHHSSYPE